MQKKTLWLFCARPGSGRGNELFCIYLQGNKKKSYGNHIHLPHIHVWPIGIWRQAAKGYLK
jgi:hypothetical protein